jgi:cytochrome P450
LSRLFTELTNGLFTLPLKWSYTTYGRALTARDRLLAHIEKVVLARQQQPTQDALGLLVQSQDEDGNQLSVAELKVQALLLLFAGHETTTSLIASLCLALARHPAILAQSRADYTFVTYGGGARICIGMAFAQMELKIVAAKLLRDYSWELLPNQNLSLDPIPTLHPRDGLKVNFQKLSSIGMCA